ncbi:unnamed protein product [Dracunculus medinensis]|uniref:BAR domain-containing protein n=1 Tax=Dracunculus medinensis TaxID=318479 RepID=A0A0N4UE99_DRAME|nr:unnamed protein product [Dracunculus medinensis]
MSATLSKIEKKFKQKYDEFVSGGKLEEGLENIADSVETLADRIFPSEKKKSPPVPIFVEVVISTGTGLYVFTNF